MEKMTLSVKEAADIIGCSLPTMYELTNREDFDCLLRLGRKKLIVKDQFVEWIRKNMGRAVL